MKKTEVGLIALCVIGSSALADVTVWSENFTTAPSAVYAVSDAILGGGLTTAGFNTNVWFSRATANMGFGNNTLKVETTGTNVRGAGIILSSSLFSAGAGIYTLTYDVTAVSSVDAGDHAQAHIFSGQGFNDTDSYYTMDVIQGSGGSSTFTASGPSASATSLISSAEITTTSTGNTLNFNYSGSGEIALVFEVDQMGAEFDNLSISTIPEPATLGLVAAAGAGILLIRRRFMI